MRTNGPAPSSLAERIVACLAAGLALAAVISLAALIAASALGAAADALAAPGWRSVFVIAYAGLPAAILLVVGLVVTRIVLDGRARARG